MVESAMEYWERASHQWLDWTGAPDQDPFGVELNLPELLELVPPPGALTLDVGCGEGRVARLLAERGHRVVGTDGSPTLVGESGRRGSAVAVADGAFLPIGDAVADLAVSCMVLMDVLNLNEHLNELHRILRPDGTLVMAVGHPVSNAGFGLGDEYLTFAIGDYFLEERMDVPGTRNGRSMPFRFWRRTLSSYLNALGQAGFAVVEAREPQPDDSFVERWPEGRQWQRILLFLHLKAVKRVVPGDELDFGWSGQRPK